MVNETIQALTYESLTAITQNKTVLLASLVIWFFPLFLYIIYGLLYTKKTNSGRSIEGTRPITKLGFWVAFFLWFFVQGALFLAILIYPIWLKI